VKLLTCDDVSFAYEGMTVISGLNFELASGDYLCVVGENGAGKSTLVKGILGLKKPAGGRLDFCDGIKPFDIGYLPQQSSIQRDFPASVYEVVLSGCLNRLGFRPFYGRKERQLAQENMRRLDIGDLKNRCYRELSGGQQQRVLLARALGAARRLLLLDEPVAGLDPMATQELYELIEKINRELGITIIMVSHDVKSALKYANKILHLRHKQLFFGDTETYRQSEIGREFIGGGEHV
jgi:zinc transport system ATP-binding protein